MFANTNPIVIGGILIVGIAVGYLVRRWLSLHTHVSLERKAQEELTRAKREAQDALLSAKEKAATTLSRAEDEARERKQELRHLEERILKKEEALERERSLFQNDVKRQREESEELRKTKEEIRVKQEEVAQEFERIAGMTREDARRELLASLERQHREELAALLVKLERAKQEHIEAKSVEVITTAIQRYARSSVADVTTSVVHLPNEDIKGKIIGREGRNIRTFERLTGVELVVDETPESILLSSFDPYRREIASIALQKLIKDGRIQPAKIEEKVEEAREELETHVQKVGEDAAYEMGILDLPKEILSLLGRLNYRTSYGQNVLVHSLEMAHIAGMIAAELGLNSEIAKKAALLHDLGKAIDHDVEGTHVEIGRRLLKKCGIDEAVIRAMEAHHEEYPFASPEAYVVAAADAISAARPGARRDTLEKYLKRLEDIEKTVMAFPGVKQTYAVSAGREVRVFVVPEKIDDFGALQLAKQIAYKIQSDVSYPGEIKVTVIREVKAVEYAR